MAGPAHLSDTVRTACAPGRPCVCVRERVMAKPKVIAVIDDVPFVLRAVGNLLAALGFKTETYASAEAFLAAVATSTATCLLVDIDLGATDGFALAHRLAADGYDIPIIFMTGRDDAAIWKRAVRAGGVALLRKPFLAGMLMEALGKAAREGD